MTEINLTEIEEDNSASISIEVVKLTNTAKLPQRMTDGASGFDLFACINEELIIPTGEYRIVPTGICINLPNGFEGQIRPRSGLALKHGITVLNSPGTIDSDYRGEIKVILINHGKEDFKIINDLRIAQIVFQKTYDVILKNSEAVRETTRGEGGFGHTGS